MNKMLQVFQDRITYGLKKKSINTASKWAEAHRMMGKPFPGPWKFDHHPWLREMHDSTAESNVGQKAAQMGYTETMLNLVFFAMDVKRWDVLYLLPAKNPDAGDFSASRFDPALESSEYLSRFFSDVQNVGHKRAGTVNLYIRGSKSRAGLKSVPAAFLVMDEMDEMNQENIKLAEERQSGQVERQDWKISTPHIDDTGINKEFVTSTQEHFFFKCPSCSRMIELKWPDSVVITSDNPDSAELLDTHLICYECKSVLPHDLKPVYLSQGVWVPSKGNTLKRGFHINQLYSPAVQPWKVAKLYLQSLTDQFAEQEFFNSKLGLTHSVSGAQITDSMFNECIGGHKQWVEGYFKTNKMVTMGIDVGKFLHFEICEWTIPNNTPYYDVNTYATPRVIRYGKVIAEFSNLDILMDQYGVHFAVIDANPLRREAYTFAQRFYGRVKLCFYTKGMSGRATVPSPEQDQAVNVDRTSWLDMSLGRFQRGKNGIVLPLDVDMEYRENLKAQVRVPMKDKDGNPMTRYLTPDSKADHYGHARNYAEIALFLGVGMGQVQTTRSPF